ncbi:hypothetical protein OG558_24810 [Kribbella sp. NBC_01510]|uniref:hypothetical protein n=1 Tax=Kribbella sp. NBC_01510 TaxID=2903581 RepID=UPI0038682587
MTSLSRKFSAVATALMTCVAMFAVAPTASAAPAASSSATATTYCKGAGTWDHVWTTTDSANGGTVCIEEYRDIVYLCDTAADGLAPRMNVATQSSSGQYNTRYTLTASGGNGTCVHAQESDGGSHDLPYDAWIYIDIWLGPLPGSYHYGKEFYING